MQGLIGREWVKFTDVVAILGNFEEEEFLAYAPGPYLLEIPTESEGAATSSDTGPIEVSELYKRSESGKRENPTRRGSRETQRIARPNLGEQPEEGEGTRSFSVEDLIKRKRRKADTRILFLGGHVRTTFGRGSDADVRIVGKAVSRVHAAFLGGAGGEVRWNVVDLGSSNGSMVNGRRLTPQLPVSIQDEPVVQLGDWRCAVMFPGRLWDVAEKLRVSL